MKHLNWRQKLARLAVGTSLVFGCVELVRAATGDWPQWRGTKRDNISTETGLLKDWPAEGPRLVWKTTGMGDGFSTTSIAGGKIFTMGDHGEVADVMALDMDGKTLWTTKIGNKGGARNPGPRSTPTVDGDRVYVLGQWGDLVCIDAGTGKEIWHKEFRSKDIGGSIDGRGIGWGYAESPLVDGNNVICTPGGKNGAVAAFDKKTGDVVWRTKDFNDHAQYSSLVPAEIGGTHQYVVFTGASVAGIAPDGKVLWRAERIGKTAMCSTPVVEGDLVYVTSDYGVGCNCFKVTGSGNDFKAEQIYANTNMKVHHGGIICLDGNVYGSSGDSLTCMSLKDGKVLWSKRSVGKGSLAYADGRLYLRSEKSGDVALVEATPEGYKEHGILKQPERSSQPAWAHPVIAGGKLYLRDDDTLYCYDIKAK